MIPLRFPPAVFSLACVVAVALTVAVGCSRQTPVRLKEGPVPTVPVRTVAVTQVDVPRATRQPATVHAYHEADIHALEHGYVDDVPVDIGDVVQEGAVLVVIDVPQLEKQRQVIEGQINRLEAEEQRRQAQVRIAETEVESAKAELAEAKSQQQRVDAVVAAAEAEFRRTEDLVQRGSLQNRILDEVRMKRDSEKANQQAVASTVESVATGITVAEAELAAAEADRRAAAAETEVMRRRLDELQVRIDYATVRAPFDGIVTRRNVDPGDLVGDAGGKTSPEPLLVVSQTDRVRVRIPVPESDAPMVSTGDTVTLTFPSFPDEPPITGVVSRVSGSLDQATRTMTAEVDLDNTDGKLLPGMFGQAQISLTTKVAATVLPARAIRFSETGEAYVYLVDPQETVVVTPVQTGLDDGNVIEVVDGLSTGQRVIDTHLQRFVDGQKVAVLAWD